MGSFVLLAYAGSAASRTLLQRLLASLNFTLDSKDLLCWYKWKCDFYELWQLHKQLKTMEMNEAWPDTYDEGYIYIYIHIAIPIWIHLQNSPAAEAEFKNIFPHSISQMIPKTIPISVRIVTSCVMKQGILLRIWDNQWKLRQQYDQNFPMKGKPL